VNWDVQRKVWDHLFGKEMFKVLECLQTYFINVHFEIMSMYTTYLQVDFADTNIVITEPYFNFTSIQESMNEILFEEYQFQSALRINGTFSVLGCSLLRLFIYEKSEHLFCF